MAIKYTHDESNQQHRYVLRRRVGATPQYRPLIFLMITTLMLVILFAMASQRPTDEFLPALIPGVGVVHGHDILQGNNNSEKDDPTINPTFILHLSINISPELNVIECIEVSESQWTHFKVGDNVGILYQRHRQDARIRIKEVGLVALNNPIR